MLGCAHRVSQCQERVYELLNIRICRARAGTDLDSDCIHGRYAFWGDFVQTLRWQSCYGEVEKERARNGQSHTLRNSQNRQMSTTTVAATTSTVATRYT